MANPTATFDTSLGTFKAEIYLDKMPITANNFIKLAKQGFYDGLGTSPVGREEYFYRIRRDGNPSGLGFAGALIAHQDQDHH
jgi:hypothetical protein